METVRSPLRTVLGLAVAALLSLYELVIGNFSRPLDYAAFVRARQLSGPWKKQRS